MRSGLLRAAKSSYLAPYLQGYTVEVDDVAETAVASVQAANITTTARTGNGKFTIVPKQIGQRVPIVVGCPGEDAPQGSFAAYIADPTTSLVTMQITEIGVGPAFAGDEGFCHVLTLGHDAMRTTKVFPEQTVKNRSNSPRALGFIVDPDGEAITSGANQAASISVTDSVTTITFARAFGRVPTAVATVIGDEPLTAQITAISATSVSVETYNIDDEAVADVPFCLIVLGWDCYAEQSNARRSVQVPQLAPRIEGVRITLAGTTASITVGADIASVTRVGAGDYTLTLTKPFKRVPVVLATGKATLVTIEADSLDVDEVKLLSFNASEAAADGTIDVLLLGYDATLEL